MPNQISQYRLTSSAFERPEEERKISPKRYVVLSVEGDRTEKAYFSYLNEHLDQTIIQIHVLGRPVGGGYSDPRQVIELLDEYLQLRAGSPMPEELPEWFGEKYSQDEIAAYQSRPETLERGRKTELVLDLKNLGIDIAYRKYLKNRQLEEDFFGVVLDRDSESHSKEMLEKCVGRCAEKGYGCYLSNPCFEFWLLLHICDVSQEFGEDEKRELLENKKVSNRHTKASKAVSERTGHSKKISRKNFEEKYWPNIEIAIQRSQQFASQYPELLEQLGTNLPDLFQKIGYSTPCTKADD